MGQDLSPQSSNKPNLLDLPQPGNSRIDLGDRDNQRCPLYRAKQRFFSEQGLKPLRLTESRSDETVWMAQSSIIATPCRWLSLSKYK
jgi:hypothetical protein